MFTESVTPEQADVFSRLLGVPLLSCDVLEAGTNREDYFTCARLCQGHLFIDPDTGLRLKVSRDRNHPSYLFGPEVISIVSERPTSLTLIFDQSLARGREREQLEKKLVYLDMHTIACFAYVSHACFILMGTRKELVKKALEVIQRESRLPTSRFLMSKTT
jgi:hypothetical protein